jgi:hypothetical protein
MSDYEFIKRTFINTYLDAPVLIGGMLDTAEDLGLYLRQDKKTRRTKRKLVRVASEEMGSDWEVSTYNPKDMSAYSMLYSTYKGRPHIKKSWQDAKNIYQAFIKGLASMTGVDTSELSVPDHPSPLAHYYYLRAGLWSKMVDVLATARVSGNNNPLHFCEGPVNFYYDQYVAILLSHEEKVATVFPFEAILMIKDSLLMRANAHIACNVIYPDTPEVPKAMEAIFGWQEKCLWVYGNKGYEVLKSVEAITKAFLMDTVDPYLSGYGNLTRIRETVVAKETKHGGSAPFLVDDLIHLLRQVEHLTTLVEVFGLQKFTGHPLIDPRTGGKSAAHEASIPRTTTYRDALRLRNNWCRMFTEGYISKTGTWPKLVFPPEKRRTTLFNLYAIRERNTEKLRECIDDWTGVSFEQQLEFDYYENFTDLMDDKSISYYRSEWKATWRRGVPVRSQRRLLLEMLSREEVSIKSIVAMVERDEIPYDWLIVSLYPKEREFKLEARMFSMMVFEMRAFFACLEANLAEKVFPYLPQQTMTLTKTQTHQRFYDLTKPAAEGTENLFLEVDLSRWNLRWRDLPIRLIGNDLNDLFGLERAYTTVHTFFKKCMILVRVNGYEPDNMDDTPPPSSDLLWYNHEGGFEGIAQKHWTIATYSMVDLGLQEHLGHYHLLGQGDNQIVMAKVYDLPLHPAEKALIIRPLAAKLKASIAKSCERVGQDAKPEECLESTRVITYSKDVFISGAEYHLSLKAWSRVFPHASSSFPTVVNNVSSLASGSINASEKMKNPIKGYFLFLFHLAMYLMSMKTRYLPETSQIHDSLKKSMDDKDRTLLMIIPSCFGGLPIASGCDFLYKGSADPSGKHLSSLRVLQRAGMEIPGVLYHTLRVGLWRGRKMNRSVLLQDPYSLPIETPQAAESAVQSVSLDYVRSESKNKDINSLVSVSVDTFELDLSRSLLATRPFNPVYCRDLIEYSLCGASQRVRKMFTATRTVQQMSLGSEADTGSIILVSSASSFLSLYERLRTLKGPNETIPDSYTGMETLRSVWSEQKERRPVGVSSYSPLDWACVGGVELCKEEGIKVMYRGSLEDPRHSHGGERPYLGTAVREKRSEHGYRIITSSSAEKAVKKLYNMLTQPGLDSSMEELIAMVAGSRTDVDLRSLVPYSSRAIGGSIIHRYAAISGSQTAQLVGCGSFATHSYLDSNRSGVLSGSLQDYPVMFQEFYALGISLLNIHVGRAIDRPYTALFRVPESIVPLPENPVTSFRRLTMEVPALPSNAIAHVAYPRLKEVEGPHRYGMIGDASVRGRGFSDTLLAVSLISRSLHDQYAAQEISDLGYGSIRIKADLLEIVGLGPGSLIYGAGVAICRAAIRGMMSRGGSQIRWTPVPVILSLADAVATSLLAYFCHPLLRGHPTVARIGGSSPMKYGKRRMVQSLSARIVKVAFAQLHDPGSLALTGEICLFQDDEKSSSISTVIAALELILASSAFCGEISPTLMYKIARVNLVNARRVKAGSETSITEVNRETLLLLEWATDSGKIRMKEMLLRLLAGSTVRLSSMTLAEHLRLVRTNSRILVTAPTPPPSAGVSPFKVPLIKRCGPVYSFLLGDKESPLYREFSIHSRVGRYYGVETAAVYTYEPVRFLFDGRQVVILGCGLGGCAAVASCGNATSVIGHDRLEDITGLCLTGTDEVPAAVTRVGGSSRFYRSRCGYQTDKGDIYNKATWDDLTDITVADPLLVVDIPMRYNTDIHRIVHRATEAYGKVRLMVRVRAIAPRMRKLITEIVSAATVEYVVLTCKYQQWEECLIVFTSSYPYSPVDCGSSETKIEYSVASPVNMAHYGGGKHTIMLEISQGLDIDDEDLIPESFVLDEMITATSKRFEHRFSYSQWSDILLLLLYRDLSSRPNPVKALSDSLSRDTVVISRHNNYAFSWTPALRRKAETLFPRAWP